MAKGRETRSKETPGAEKDSTSSRAGTDAEKIKHCMTPKDETGAPKGKNRSNASDQTS